MKGSATNHDSHAVRSLDCQGGTEEDVRRGAGDERRDRRRMSEY